MVGVYPTAAQVGFARAFSDGVALAYLADVYVLPGAPRAQGSGVELVREMVENGPLADVKWMLHTPTRTTSTGARVRRARASGPGASPLADRAGSS